MKKAFTLIWLFVSVCHCIVKEGDRVNCLEPSRIHIKFAWVTGRGKNIQRKILFSFRRLKLSNMEIISFITSDNGNLTNKKDSFLIDYLFRHEQCSKSDRCCSCDYLRAAERLSSCLPLLTRWHCVCWPLHTPSVPRLTAKQRDHTDGGGEGSGFLG